MLPLLTLNTWLTVRLPLCMNKKNFIDDGGGGDVQSTTNQNLIDAS